MSSLKNKYTNAIKKINDGKMDEVNLSDLMEETCLNETEEFIEYWSANRTQLKVHVESVIYDCFTEFTTYEFNSRKNPTSKVVNQMVHARINSILKGINISFKHASPSIKSHVETAPKPDGEGVILIYKIDINKTDLNFLKVKNPKLYHKLSSYTIDNPMRIG